MIYSVIIWVVNIQCGFASLDLILHDSITQFTKDVYDILRLEEGNLLVSPVSIQTLLAMLANGAENQTLQDLIKVGHLPKNKTEMNKDFSHVIERLKNKKFENFQSMSGIFSDLPLKNTFRSFMLNYYEPDMKKIEFIYPKKVEEKLSSWVKKKTKNKIKDILAADDLDVVWGTMILANVVYFQSHWLLDFDKTQTAPGQFHTLIGAEEPTLYMTLDKYYAIGVRECPELDSMIIQLPFSGKCALIIIRPNEIEGLKVAEERFKYFDLNKIKDVEGERIVLKLPKIKLVEAIDLDPLLTYLGTKDLFSPNASLSGIATDSKIYKAVHKARLRINEFGADVSETDSEEESPGRAVGKGKGGKYKRPIITVDRPFLLLIVLKATYTPLYIGRVKHPAKP